MAGWQAVEGAGWASSDSRRSQPAAAGPEPAARPHTGSQRAHQRPQRHPQGDAATQPAAAARARQAARRRRRRPPKATACPLCPSPAALSRASPRPGARDARRVGRAALRRCCCCCPPLQPPPPTSPLNDGRSAGLAAPAPSSWSRGGERRPLGAGRGVSGPWLPILTLISPPLPTTTPHPTQGRQNGGRYASVTRGARSKGIFMCGIQCHFGGIAFCCANASG